VRELAEKEVRLIRRGVPRWEYIAYFKSLGIEQAPGWFTGADWEVIVGEEKEVIIMHSCLPETEVIFRAEEEIVKAMVDVFRIKFMRAGG
jgi:hypothetical protein